MNPECWIAHNLLVPGSSPFGSINEIAVMNNLKGFFVIFKTVLRPFKWISQLISVRSTIISINLEQNT